MFDSITHPKKRAFLTLVSETGVVKEAAELAGISRELHYDWKAQDPDYAEAFAEAMLLAADALEDEARRRALNPTRRSDKVLTFLLERLKPEVFGKKVELNAQVQHKQAIDYSAFTDEELDLLERLAHKAGAVEPRRDQGRTDDAEADEAPYDVPGDGTV